MKASIKILFNVITVILLNSCGNDTVINNIISSGPFTLSGNIENWTLGGNIKLKAELYDTNYYLPLVLDSTIINNSGAFSLKFNIPHDSMLYPITFYPDTVCISNVTVNPPGTKSSSSTGLYLYGDTISIGYIYRSNYMIDTIPLPGQFFTYYLYLDRNVSITGSRICNYSYFDTIIYNFSGVRGWNKLVVLYNSFTANSMKVTISANEPAGGKWFASTWTGDDASVKSSFLLQNFRFNECIPCK